MNQIRINNIDKWNGAKAKDFVQKKTDLTMDLGTPKANKDTTFYISTEAQDDENTLVINEEVKTTEYAPACF